MSVHTVTSPADFAEGSLRNIISALPETSDDPQVIDVHVEGPINLIGPLEITKDNVQINYNDTSQIGHGLIIRGNNCVVSDGDFVDVAGDGVQFIGINARKGGIYRTKFRITGSPGKEDEALSVVHGAGSEGIRLGGCTFLNWPKAVLIGSEELKWHEREKKCRVSFVGCRWEGCSRRNPFVRHGEVEMHHCDIIDWGRNFLTKSYGVRAANGAVIEMRNCKIKQSWKSLLRIDRVIRDIFQGCGPHKAFIEESGGCIDHKGFGNVTSPFWVS